MKFDGRKLKEMRLDRESRDIVCVGRMQYAVFERAPELFLDMVTGIWAFFNDTGNELAAVAEGRLFAEEAFQGCWTKAGDKQVVQIKKGGFKTELNIMSLNVGQFEMQNFFKIVTFAKEFLAARRRCCLSGCPTMQLSSPASVQLKIICANPNKLKGVQQLVKCGRRDRVNTL